MVHICIYMCIHRQIHVYFTQLKYAEGVTFYTSHDVWIMLSLCSHKLTRPEGLMTTVCLSSTILQTRRLRPMWWLCYIQAGSFCACLLTVCTTPQQALEEPERGWQCDGVKQTEGPCISGPGLEARPQGSVFLLLPLVYLLFHPFIFMATTTDLSSNTVDFCLRYFY